MANLGDHLSDEQKEKLKKVETAKTPPERITNPRPQVKPRKTVADFQNQKKVCVDCRVSFDWTPGEQLYWYDRDIPIPPKRCEKCRLLRRQGMGRITHQPSN